MLPPGKKCDRWCDNSTDFCKQRDYIPFFFFFASCAAKRKIRKISSISGWAHLLLLLLQTSNIWMYPPESPELWRIVWTQSDIVKRNHRMGFFFLFQRSSSRNINISTKLIFVELTVEIHRDKYNKVNLCLFLKWGLHILIYVWTFVLSLAWSKQSASWMCKFVSRQPMI